MIRFTLQRPPGPDNFDPLHAIVYGQLDTIDPKIKARFPKSVDRLRLVIDEEIDNILEHDKNAKTIDIELEIDLHGNTRLKLVYDGLPHDSVSGKIQAPVIRGAIRRLAAEYTIHQTSVKQSNAGNITTKIVTFQMKE